MAREPAGIAIASPTFTSRETLASTRSSIRAVSLDMRVSVCRPITEFGETTSSSKIFCGGSGARCGSGARRRSFESSIGLAETVSPGAVEEAGDPGAPGNDVAGGCETVVVGHERSSAGAGGSGRRVTTRGDWGAAAGARRGVSAGVAFPAASLLDAAAARETLSSMTASVS
jgi:hypothetical protein